MNRKLSPSMKTMLLVSGAVVLIMTAISTYVWTQVPAGATVCIHWNAAGDCDGIGSKFMGIFLMPLTVLGMAGLFAVMPRIEPRAANFAQSRGAYAVVWGAMLLFFLALHIIMMLEILGHKAGMGVAAPVLTGLMLTLIGSSLGHVRSNYFFGIRTPWTLSSDLSWDKTHRLGGRLFMLLGLVFMVAPLVLPGEVWVYGLIGGILALVVILTAYSYFIWRGDENAHPH